MIVYRVLNHAHGQNDQRGGHQHKDKFHIAAFPARLFQNGDGFFWADGGRILQSGSGRVDNCWRIRGDGRAGLAELAVVLTGALLRVALLRCPLVLPAVCGTCALLLVIGCALGMRLVR